MQDGRLQQESWHIRRPFPNVCAAFALGLERMRRNKTARMNIRATRYMRMCLLEGDETDLLRRDILVVSHLSLCHPEQVMRLQNISGYDVGVVVHPTAVA